MNVPTSTQSRSPIALGLGAAFGVSCLITAAQLFDKSRGADIAASDVWGPVVVGIPLLMAVLAVGAALRRAPAASATGAVVLAAVAWLSMIVWWVAAPAYFGVTAAWVAGILDRDAAPPRGAARAAGIVGLFAAGANVLLVVGALLLTIF